MDSELAFASAVDIRQMIADREISAVELTEFFYRRIDELNPRLSAYLALCPDQALADAQAADAAVRNGDTLGPLHGIPISIKDLEMTKGITTTLGSAIFRDRVPEIDSIVVERVKAAGAIILGKTNTPEFGQSGTTENLVSEPCRNPWNTDYTPGGRQRRSGGGADRRPLHPGHRQRRRRQRSHPGQFQWRNRHQTVPTGACPATAGTAFRRSITSRSPAP